MWWKTPGMIDSTPPVVELTTTRSKMVLTFEKSVFLAPGTLVTVHAAGEKKGHTNILQLKFFYCKQSLMLHVGHLL